MEFLTNALLVFLIGTVFLIRKGYQRYFIIFLIRTEYGLKFIDYLAKLAPRFWKFLADFSVVISFSGLGGAYISKKGNRVSLYLSLIIIGVSSLVLYNPGYRLLIVGVLLVLGILRLFYSKDDTRVDFLLTTLIVFSLVSQIFTVSSLALLEAVFGLPVLLMFSLASNAFNIISQSSDLPGISPLMPASRDGNIGVTFPGYDIFVPWWHALIAIMVTLIAHESAHGILARVHNMQLKSTGLLTFGILPIGAFVEPDEAEIETRPSIEKMRLFSMGSFANFAVGAAAAAAIFLIVSVTSSQLVGNGIEIVGFSEGYPAEKVLSHGLIIESLNNISTLDLDSFRKVMENVTAGSEILLGTDAGYFNINTTVSPNDNVSAYIGVLMNPKLKLKNDIIGRYESAIDLISYILTSLSWIVFFNINIGLVNLLPIAPFDGGRMFREILLSFKLSKVALNKIVYAILLLTIIIFLINLYPLFGLAYDWLVSL